MSESKLKNLTAESDAQLRTFRRGEPVHQIGIAGKAWRVQSGAVRLDAIGPDGLMFASLALPGDVIGAEALVSGHYAFAATALTPCVLARWKAPKTSLLGLLATTQRRAADVVALRCGRAADRVARLAQLLGTDSMAPSSNMRALMPRLRDIADITNLTIETVSRVAATTLDHASGVAQPARRSPCTSGFTGLVAVPA